MQQYIFSGLFIGLMIPVFLILLLPRVTIKMLELLKIYPPGSLTTTVKDIISGSNVHKRERVYLYTHKNIVERFESGRVFGALALIFIPISIGISVVVYWLK